MTDHMEILKALPVLPKIWNTRTLADYFTQTLAPLKNIEATPEKKMFINAISREIERLYGEEKAASVCQQVDAFPVIETGTHLAFLRDYDSMEKDDLRSRLNQNVVISSALMRHMGQKYHVGVYGSNVSLNRGGFFQLGDEIFPVTSLTRISQVCLYDAPHIEKTQFNTALPLFAKLKMLDEVLTKEVIDKTPMSYKEQFIKTKKIARSLLEPLQNGKTNYGIVEKGFYYLNENNQNLIKSTMLALSAETYKKYGYTFSDVDKQYQELEEVFVRPNLKLPDQVTLIQAKTINKILEGTEIEHISVDAVEVVRQFLISALENPNSLWYKIFDNEENFKKMHQTFINIRGSWKEEESPFDYIRHDKGFSKCLSLPFNVIDHHPQSLIPLLKQKQIIPSSGLMILIFQSAGMMAHGGYFQSTYADKIKKRFVGFLQDIGETKRAEQVKMLPVDMALLSLAVVNDDTDQPMKLSQIARMSVEKRKALMDMIPEYPSCRAVVNALPVLGRYLASSAPGYVESEATHTETPPLSCHLDNVLQWMNLFNKKVRS